MVCRHLALAHATGVIGGENKYTAITSGSYGDILNDDELDKKYDRKCPTEAHYFEFKKLPVALKAIANEVWSNTDDTRKSYTFTSSMHLMTLHIEKANGALKICFYDPNDTLRHKKFIMEHPDEIDALSIDHILTRSAQKKYFGKKAATACLVSTETQKDRDSCQVNVYGSLNDFYLPLKYGHYGHKNIPDGFNATSIVGIPGLYVALERGQAAAVKAYLSNIFKSNCERPSVTELLMQTHDDDRSTVGLDLAIFHGHIDAITAYVNGIMESGLDQADISRLLRLGANNAKHNDSLLFYKSRYKSAAAFKAYSAAISASKLDRHIKKQLLHGFDDISDQASRHSREIG